MVILLETELEVYEHRRNGWYYFYTTNWRRRTFVWLSLFLLELFCGDFSLPNSLPDGRVGYTLKLPFIKLGVVGIDNFAI